MESSILSENERVSAANDHLWIKHYSVTIFGNILNSSFVGCCYLLQISQNEFL